MSRDPLCLILRRCGGDDSFSDFDDYDDGDDGKTIGLNTSVSRDV